MLSARELFRAQGSPDAYVIDPIFNGKPLENDAAAFDPLRSFASESQMNRAAPVNVRQHGASWLTLADPARPNRRACGDGAVAEAWDTNAKTKQSQLTPPGIDDAKPT
jgi:hypothetical protein